MQRDFKLFFLHFCSSLTPHFLSHSNTFSLLISMTCITGTRTSNHACFPRSARKVQKQWCKENWILVRMVVSNHSEYFSTVVIKVSENFHHSCYRFLLLLYPCFSSVKELNLFLDEKKLRVVKSITFQ